MRAGGIRAGLTGDKNGAPLAGKAAHVFWTNGDDMNNKPIGVFDSGVGGLTAVKELHKILPHEDILYFGDTGRVPYGTRSRETILKYAAQDIQYLLTNRVKAVVIACGTVSANVNDELLRRMGVNVPCTGVVLPATRAACALSATGRIGVIATTAAIRSGAYGRAMRSIRPSAKVFGNAAPLFVPLVENGLTDYHNQITRLTAQMYLEPLVREKIDTLILGCTHFPLLYDIINDILDYRVALIDSGAQAAQYIKSLLCEQTLLSDRTTPGSTLYRVTDTVESFVGVAGMFLGEDVKGLVEHVELEAIGG